MIWLLVVVTLDRSGTLWPPIELVGKYRLEQNCNATMAGLVDRQTKRNGDKFYFCVPLDQAKRFDDY